MAIFQNVLTCICFMGGVILKIVCATEHIIIHTHTVLCCLNSIATTNIRLQMYVHVMWILFKFFCSNKFKFSTN